MHALVRNAFFRLRHTAAARRRPLTRSQRAERDWKTGRPRSSSSTANTSNPAKVACCMSAQKARLSTPSPMPKSTTSLLCPGLPLWSFPLAVPLGYDSFADWEKETAAIQQQQSLER